MKTQLIIFMCCQFGITYAQTDKSIKVYGEQPVIQNQVSSTQDTCAKRMHEARAYMKGYNHAYNPSKAFDLCLPCAASGNPQAMNAIGIMYNKGIGTGKDQADAMKWFQKAADLNYAQGWYNLGLMYKFAQGVPQDFTKAYQCFKRAADLNYYSALSYQGYMFYKGLGVEQDYNKAFDFFQKAADKSIASGMYYLGLCYRNGYGVAQDTATGRFWLQKSAKMGYLHSEEELATGEPENITPSGLKSQNSNEQVPEKLRRIKHHVAQKDISGIYNGYLVTYDWSKEHAITQVPLELKLNVNGNIVSGEWIENKSLSAGITATLTDTCLNFTDAQIRRPDHYNQVEPLLWQFKKGDLEVIRKDAELYLAGNIQFYLPEKMEPGKPMYISLKQTVAGEACGNNCTCGSDCKCNHSNNCCTKTKSSRIEKTTAIENSGILNDLRAYPNPFGNTLNLSFTLNADSEVKVVVLKMDGTQLFQTSFGLLKAGAQKQTLDLTATAGVYVVKLMADKSEVSTVVVKQ